jgi:hypothetical protein
LALEQQQITSHDGRQVSAAREKFSHRVISRLNVLL